MKFVFDVLDLELALLANYLGSEPTNEESGDRNVWHNYMRALRAYEHTNPVQKADEILETCEVPDAFLVKAMYSSSHEEVY